MAERLVELMLQTDIEEMPITSVLQIVDDLVVSLYCTRCPIKQQCKEAALKYKNTTCKEMLLLYINGTIQRDGEE